MNKSLCLFSTFIILFASCVTETIVNRYVYDFRPYTDEAFYITPNAYNQEHKPIGIIALEIIPGPGKVISEGNDPIYSKTITVKEIYSPDTRLEMFVDMAKELGATGISNFETHTYYENGHISRHILKGFAFSTKIQ